MIVTESHTTCLHAGVSPLQTSSVIRHARALHYCIGWLSLNLEYLDKRHLYNTMYILLCSYGIGEMRH